VYLRDWFRGKDFTADRIGTFQFQAFDGSGNLKNVTRANGADRLVFVKYQIHTSTLLDLIENVNDFL
jgi:hypothetical protein